MSNYKYILLCGGMNTKEQKRFEKPRHLLEIKGEPIVARTIRLLRENGVEDISISTDAPELFEGFGVQIIKRHFDSDSVWLECFPSALESTCFIFGDVVFSPEAIKTIVEKETEDIEFFASAPPFPVQYKKRWAEPFAFKVKVMHHFFNAIEDTYILRDYKAFKREPIAWELWQVIKRTPLNIIDYTNYTVINDYTCDIDEPEDIKNFQFI